MPLDPNGNITAPKGPPVSENGNGNGAWTQRYSSILQTVTVVALFISGFFIAVIGPMNSHLEVLDREKLSEEASRILREDWNRRYDELRAAVLKVQDAQVPRAEHEQHWVTDSRRIEDLRGTVLDMQKEFNTTFNAGDALKNLQKELDDLRSQVHRDNVTVSVPGPLPVSPVR